MKRKSDSYSGSCQYNLEEQNKKAERLKNPWKNQYQPNDRTIKISKNTHRRVLEDWDLLFLVLGGKT